MSAGHVPCEFCGVYGLHYCAAAGGLHGGFGCAPPRTTLTEADVREIVRQELDRYYLPLKETP